MFHLNPPLPSPRTGTLEIRLVLIILYQVCMHLTYRRASFLTQRKGHGSSLLRDLTLDSNKLCKHDQLQSTSNLWILAAMPSDTFVGNFQLASLWPKHLMYICHKLSVTRLLRSISSPLSSSVLVSDSPWDIRTGVHFLLLRLT
ncbi:hypothetical protein ACQJBY_018149 [Aegilops geniculata]